MSKRALVLLLLLPAIQARAGIYVEKIDLLAKSGLGVNAAGPVIVRMDEARNRLIVVNTLTSSLSLVDCPTSAVENIPLSGRAFQHLKAECLTIDPKTGNIYLIGRNCFHIVTPASRSSREVPTGAQFESIAVDANTGNVFVAGRESAEIGFYKASSGKLGMVPWLGTREELINLNATPPPPIRKVVSDDSIGRIIAVDGTGSRLYLFDSASGVLVSSRPLDLAPGGRWHLGGYDRDAHRLCLVAETAERKVIQAARIDAEGEGDVIIPLPGYTEGVGVIYNPVRDEVYIPYDNHPSVHVACFSGKGSLEEILVPAYGNDASALDAQAGLLFIGSWAHGEIDVVDIGRRELRERITELGIIPHMFTMAFNPADGLLYFPKGATAVNGSFGSAVTVLDRVTREIRKIRTGWAPIDLVEAPARNSFLVFDNEDGFAEVMGDGSFVQHRLPFDYPVRAERGPDGDIFLSYGPHQSYWPVVYIWGAKNGILTIDGEDLSLYDRRIPRQAHELVFDSAGILYMTQNNWGKEEQFLGRMRDPVRLFDINDRIPLADEVEREITQRILRFDPAGNLLYLVRTAERDEDTGVLQVISADSGKVLERIPVGITATDLCFDASNVYVANFDSRNVSGIIKSDWTVTETATSEEPLRVCALGGAVYALTHRGNTLELIAEGGRIREKGKSKKIPFRGMPDNMTAWNGGLVISSYSGDEFRLIFFDPKSGKFSPIHSERYPYGDTYMGSRNVSFYMRGQYGDAVFSLTRFRAGSDGKLRVTEFLSGKMFILGTKREGAEHGR